MIYFLIMCEFGLIPVEELFPLTIKYFLIRSTTLNVLSSFLLPPFLLIMHCGKTYFSDTAFYHEEPKQQDPAS